MSDHNRDADARGADLQLWPAEYLAGLVADLELLRRPALFPQRSRPRDHVHRERRAERATIAERGPDVSRPLAEGPISDLELLRRPALFPQRSRPRDHVHRERRAERATIAERGPDVSRPLAEGPVPGGLGELVIERVRASLARAGCCLVGGRHELAQRERAVQGS